MAPQRRTRTMKILWQLVFLAAWTDAFTGWPSHDALRSKSGGIPPATLLHAKGIKRGKLGKTVGSSSSSPPPPAAAVPDKRVKKKQSKRTSAAAASKKSETVSPALAAWAAASTPDSATTQSQPPSATISDDVATSFVSFQEETSGKTSSRRRVKQSERQVKEEQRNEQVQAILGKLESLLEEKSGATLDDIINSIRPLLQLQESQNGLRQLTASSKEYFYRLAWVGSDEAICHIGTGLHKVPLARMQEVFLTCQGRNRVELLEVIRVLGPFPNVRNTLQGDAKVKLLQQSDDDELNLANWEITMDSMIDGTGKEILAGTEDNIRRVSLQVYFADPNAIVAVVPPKEGGARDDPFEESGAHVLLFVREDDLETKLEQLRVL